MLVSHLYILDCVLSLPTTIQLKTLMTVSYSKNTFVLLEIYDLLHSLSVLMPNKIKKIATKTRGVAIASRSLFVE